ncbi:hypothetical protein GCM10027299_43260 [Larkinella ripae]
MNQREQSSGKGTIFPNQPESIESTVNSEGKPSLTTFVTLANAQVEAALNHFIKYWQGSDIPEKELHGLTEQIKNIIALNFIGETPVLPDSTFPIYVQVPEYIADHINDPFQPEFFVEAIKMMRDATMNDPQFVIPEGVDYEELAYALQDVIAAAHQTVTGRATGKALHPAAVPSGNPMPFVPRFIIDRLGDAEKAESLVELVNKVFSDAEWHDLNENNAEDQEAIHGLRRAIVQWVNMAHTAQQTGNSHPLPEKEEDEQTDENKVVLDRTKTDYYFAASQVVSKTVAIESNSILFDIITEPDDLGLLIGNLAAWYSCWVEHIDESAGDLRTAHYHFASLMAFLGMMPVAIADVVADKAKDAHEMAVMQTRLDATNELIAEIKGHNATLRDSAETARKSMQLAEEMRGQRDALAEEVKRLRDQHEPATETSPAEPVTE